MQVINIYPLGNICMERLQNIHMYLTHMVEKYPAYVEAAKQFGGYKILDNSLIELGGSVDMNRLLRAAGSIEADEIILPDKFQDGPGTLEAVDEAVKTLFEIYPKGNWPYKLMAVAQGKNEEEWLQCYKALLANRYIDVIGIPKVLAKMHPAGRPYFVNAYCCLGRKGHHLLGLWYSFSELKEYRCAEHIRSCDTVLLGFMAKYNLGAQGIRPDGFTIDLEKDVIDYSKVDSPW